DPGDREHAGANLGQERARVSGRKCRRTATRKAAMADDGWVPRGEQSAQGRRFPRRPVAPFPGSDGSLRPGEHLLVTVGRGCGCGQTARWVTVWIAWGGHGASLW